MFALILQPNPLALGSDLRPFYLLVQGVVRRRPESTTSAGGGRKYVLIFKMV